MNYFFQEARKKKDRNFDGTFFFAVKTTGIFCRPSCPSPTAKEENVLYFSSIFEALDKGYKPCRRCRPDIIIEYYNTNINGTLVVKNALDKIYRGYLNEHSLSDLADNLNLSGRHLRKLFTDNLGISPLKIANFHKAMFAKKLLTCTNHSITEIALSSGFNSIRQFNDIFKSVFNRTPSEIKKSSDKISKSVLHLYYRDDFDFNQILSFMKPRLIKGVETADDNSYSRTFRIKSSTGYFTVTDNKDLSALELAVHCSDIKCYMELYYRVRKMFDMDTDFSQINNKFKDDPLLSKGMKNNHVPGLPVAFNSYEFTIRAILGQQITVKAATTLAARIASKNNSNSPEDYPDGLEYYFPFPEEISKLDLSGIGITGIRQITIKTVTDALLNNKFSLSHNQAFDKFDNEFSSLKGIGDWTVNYVAMRGLGMADSFPASDLGIIKALSKDNRKPSEKEIIKKAENWRPWRAYAALCLWNSLKGD